MRVFTGYFTVHLWSTYAVPQLYTFHSDKLTQCLGGDHSSFRVLTCRPHWSSENKSAQITLISCVWLCTFRLFTPWRGSCVTSFLDDISKLKLTYVRNLTEKKSWLMWFRLFDTGRVFDSRISITFVMTLCNICSISCALSTVPQFSMTYVLISNCSTHITGPKALSTPWKNNLREDLILSVSKHWKQLRKKKQGHVYESIRDQLFILKYISLYILIELENATYQTIRRSL